MQGQRAIVCFDRASARVGGRSRRAGFTLLELLTVLAIVGFLMAVLMPSLGRAREQARIAGCASNLRQLLLANDLYAQDSGGFYCPGMADALKNLHRWHGERASVHEAFDGSRGPLAMYIGGESEIRRCQSFEPEVIGFEAGNGGYGYNRAYLGVQSVPMGPVHRRRVTSDLAGTLADRVRRPADTLMFSDAAMVTTGLIEYSFAEPRFHPQFGTRADPSLHFRHLRQANVGWCDGHVDRRVASFSWSSGLYPGDPARFGVGWFGEADDNRYFDIE